MHSLLKPNINFRELFHQCIGKKKTALQNKFSNKVELLNSASKNYESKAIDRKLYQIIPLTSHDLEPVTSKDLNGLYSKQLSKKGTEARLVYDEILAGAIKYLCCFCSYGEPTELDHFLPKSRYPEFSILPINLVPICHYCNRLKLNKTPTSTEYYIHPYFEEYSKLQWLVADLKFNNDVPFITFQIKKDLEEEAPEIFARINYQFHQLNLNHRYSLSANTEIGEMLYRLNQLHESGGSKMVRDYLQEEAHLLSNNNQNSWKCALYHCLCKNHQFCNLSWVTWSNGRS